MRRLAGIFVLLKDNPREFGVVSIALHWINALAVIALLVVGVISFFAPHGKGVGYRHELLELHTSIALVALPFIVMRTFWRVRYGKPEALAHGPVLKRVADIVWPLLLVGIVLQLLTGPFLYQTHHLPMKLFGVTVVQPFLPRMNDLYAVLQMSHELIGFALAALVTLHVLGALRHLLIERDGVFSRMLWPREPRAQFTAGDKIEHGASVV